MTAFEQYLYNNNFLPHKCLCKKVNGRREFYYEPITIEECGFFSTMQEGRIDNVWIKDDKKIFFGLSEINKPPTITSPRKCTTDDEINNMIKSEKFEDILKFLYS